MAIISQLFKENTAELTQPSGASVLHSQFTQNLADIVNLPDDAPASALSLGAAFDVAHNTAMARAYHAAQNEELLGLNSGSIEGRIEAGGIASNRAQEAAARTAADEKRATDTVTFLALLDQLHAYEDGLAEKYGENFAEDALSDLREEGFVDEETYNRIMAIEDKSERRQAIAQEIQRMLNEGEITMDNLKDHPWAQEWLDMHNNVLSEANNTAQNIYDGVYSYSPIENDQLIVDRLAALAIENGEDPEEIFELRAEKNADVEISNGEVTRLSSDITF